MASFSDLNELLDSEAGEIARKLDADDGSYDGSVDVDIFNKFLLENGFRSYEFQDGVKTIAYIDVVKMIYNLKREQQVSGDSKIRIDFDPAEEMRKARKQVRW